MSGCGNSSRAVGQPALQARRQRQQRLVQAVEIEIRVLELCQQEIFDTLEPVAAALRHHQAHGIRGQLRKHGERKTPADTVDARKHHSRDRRSIEHARLRKEAPHRRSQVKVEPLGANRFTAGRDG
jgi:hypothetical protein